MSALPMMVSSGLLLLFLLDVVLILSRLLLVDSLTLTPCSSDAADAADSDAFRPTIISSGWWWCGCGCDEEVDDDSEEALGGGSEPEMVDENDADTLRRRMRSILADGF